MNMRFTVFIALCIIASQIRAQLFIGAGAAIHRYDQVLSFRMVKPLNYGGLGLDLGLGVERSLQGALAPQLALCFQAPMSASSLSKKIAPFYALRYQFDFQKSSFLDTYHGVYFGAGLGYVQEIDFDLKNASGVETSYSQDGKIAYQFIAGTSYGLTENWDLTADVRYMRTDSINLKRETGGTAELRNVDYDPVSLTVGAVYKF